MLPNPTPFVEIKIQVISFPTTGTKPLKDLQGNISPSANPDPKSAVYTVIVKSIKPTKSVYLALASDL